MTFLKSNGARARASGHLIPEADHFFTLAPSLLVLIFLIIESNELRVFPTGETGEKAEMRTWLFFYFPFDKDTPSINKLDRKKHWRKFSNTEDLS